MSSALITSSSLLSTTLLGFSVRLERDDDDAGSVVVDADAFFALLAAAVDFAAPKDSVDCRSVVLDDFGAIKMIW